MVIGNVNGLLLMVKKAAAPQLWCLGTAIKTGWQHACSIGTCTVSSPYVVYSVTQHKCDRLYIGLDLNLLEKE